MERELDPGDVSVFCGKRREGEKKQMVVHLVVEGEACS